MRARSLKKPHINVITLGCSKNWVDTEVLMGQLRANDFEVDHEKKNKHDEVVIINTCGFIDKAKEESIQTILHYNQLKEKGKVDQLIVTGCLSERYKKDLEIEIPGVDAYFGTTDLPRLLEFLKADYKHELLGERVLNTPSHYAFFKISEGCDRPCSFCAIPIMRGVHRSKPLESIIQEAKNLVGRGVKELILIAQDLTYYGLDLYKERKLAFLLESLAGIEGLEWIRLQYAYPSQFPMDALDIIRDYPQICNYLDMPLQHISDPMLKSMRRGITQKRTLQLLDEIRNRVPGIALRTTLISGYPGETEKDFEELIQFVESQRFERLGIFTYSHEEQTHAHTLEDDVPEEIKQERSEMIMEIQQGISFEKNQAWVGKETKIIVDRKEGEYWIGRTEFDSPEVDNEVLILAKDYYLKPGNFYQVKIDKAEHFDLFAHPLEIPRSDFR